MIFTDEKVLIKLSKRNKVLLTPTHPSPPKKLASFSVPEEVKKSVQTMFLLWLLIEIELLHLLLHLLVLGICLLLDNLCLATSLRHGVEDVWCEYYRCTEH